MHFSVEQIEPGSLAAWAGQAAARMEAAGLVFAHGTASAWDEACWMISHTLGLPPDFDDSVLSGALGAAQRERLEGLLASRIESRKPLAYLIGEAWFAGLCFKIDDRVLVPRSPIAELIREGFAPWLNMDELRHAADVGTGSGCLAIALAHYWPQLRVDASDISEQALEVARLNAKLHDVEDRVRFLRSDLMRELEGPYDLILCNPPYVPAASMSGLEQEHRHEPELALAGGRDGLDLVRRIFAEAADRMRPGGILMMEVGESRAVLEEVFPGIPFIWLEFVDGGDGVFLLDDAGCTEAARHVRGK